jgi:hypothetical protein
MKDAVHDMQSWITLLKFPHIFIQHLHRKFTVLAPDCCVMTVTELHYDFIMRFTTFIFGDMLIVVMDFPIFSGLLFVVFPQRIAE